MDTIIFACPNCKSLNKLPKKNEYKKAICGNCKANLLENSPIESDDYNEFNKIISSITIPIIIDFWAPRCGPCQMFAPTFKKVATYFPLKAQFVKVNTEINQQVAMNFQIRSIPTIVALKNKTEIDRIMGAVDEASFKTWVDKIIKSTLY